MNNIFNSYPNAHLTQIEIAELTKKEQEAHEIEKEKKYTNRMLHFIYLVLHRKGITKVVFTFSNKFNGTKV